MGGDVSTAEFLAMRQAAEAHDDDRQLRAMRSSRSHDMAKVRFHKSRGMSRKRLVEIYGRDLVDLTLAAA